MKEIGIKIYNMEWDPNFGLMELSSKVLLKMVKSIVVYSVGLMEINMKDSLSETK